MLTKQGIDVSFAQGLDTKTDPKRVAIGKFTVLENTVFQKSGLLQKRNGFKKLTALPDSSYSILTTLNDNLTAIGQSIASYNSASDNWISRGSFDSLSVTTVPIVRNNLNQQTCDSAVSNEGLVCTAYIENNGGVLTNKFIVSDSVTGQNIMPPTAIPVVSGTVSGGMRVFYLSNKFLILFTNNIAGVKHLRYIAISAIGVSSIIADNQIAASYVEQANLSYDATIVGTSLYVAYSTLSGGQQIAVTVITGTLQPVPVPTAIIGPNPSSVSLCADISNPSAIVIYVVWIEGNDFKLFAVDAVLQQLVGITNLSALAPIGNNITSIANNGVCSIAGETNGDIWGINFTYATLTTGSPFPIIRGVGLASKVFAIGDFYYFLAVYSSAYQPTYFLINASVSTENNPVIAAKLAYSNAGPALTKGLPGVTVNGDVAQFGYLIKDLIAAVNKDTAVPSGTQTAGIYSQTGINLATLSFGTSKLVTSEIANVLHITGGFLWLYDGYVPVEHNFFLWPDVGPTASPNPINTTVAAWSAAGGSMAAQPDGATNTNAYFYQFTYEWTDNQGNAYRSAPSIPIAVTTTGAGSTGAVTLTIPTLRLTMKTDNPVKIVVYRWSVRQQSYFQTTSITSPVLNSTAANSVIYVDQNSDATILGNNLIYTTGGVIEDVNAPATDHLTLFDTRLWAVSAEDKNVLWYSKQVIEATPVEMSDLFTVYIPPSVSTQGITGPITAIAPMDDKLIIGKDNALIYINGTGPDNTGSNNQYSPATLITSTVGCSNQRSIVQMPKGLMFQSDKGIWLLGRDLSTEYIGAPVEDLTTGATVLSAVNVPETNQVRFILDTGITLMYDYFFGQWGSFKGIKAVSSVIYQGKNALINAAGQSFVESKGFYLDGTNPILMRFTTGPLRLGDLQNYQRAYFFYILGEYLSPHKLNIALRFDYESAPSQVTLITPDNYSTPYGSGVSQSPYGEGDPYGGPSAIELWRVFLANQRCMAFTIELTEVFDASQGTVPGAGLTISGLNVVCGFKKAYRPQQAATSAG